MQVAVSERIGNVAPTDIQRMPFFFRGVYVALTHIQRYIYHVYVRYISFPSHSLVSNACHFLLRVARGSNIFFQIMVTFLISYISNALSLFVRGGRVALE